ncbi:uncharacterized protein LOC128272339 [Anopheles cruzii]|uniref:uncharacterized protein LOC128272339 n=1 Tax=Anopheles cruzii TaxID=68878 RepID=UPI0022EC3A55|nr:uncharacterized protein LOC128272339 [Anopheles cruzii]
MAASRTFVLAVSVAVLATAISAAPTNVVVKPHNAELQAALEEYRVRFDDLHTEKDQFLQFARTGLWASLRHMNEEVLQDLGETRNTVEFGFDDVRTEISLVIINGTSNEQCLLDLVREIIDEKVVLGTEISRCAAVTIATMDALPQSFYEFINLLQRLSSSIAETTLYSFVSQNSVIDPERHLAFLEDAFVETERTWVEEALPLIQFELDAMEYNRPVIVDENAECLQVIAAQQQSFEANIRSRIPTCA